jgi:tetratricopeptide (TPR) repeat protein
MDKEQAAAREAIIAARGKQRVLTRELAETYLERYPEDPIVWAYYGDALTDLGCFSQARVALERARALARSVRQKVTAVRFMARLFEETGDYPSAESLYRRAAELEPHRGCWWLFAGATLRRQGRDTEAAQCYRRALGLEGARDEYLLNLGYVLQARGEYEEALACFRVALNLDPQYERAMAGVAELEAVLRVREEGRLALRRAQRRPRSYLQ